MARPEAPDVHPEKQGEDGPRPARPDERRGRGHGAERDRPQETWLQLIVTWASGLLILLVVGYLVWEGTRPFTPAEFRASVQEVRPVGGEYHVRLRVTNTGGQSVASLEVVLELREGEQLVADSSAVLDWLPESSSRELVLIVPHDPGEHERVIRFDGYRVP